MARLPDQIGKYEVVDRIGKGGMGLVYKAKHPTLDRFVILKKLNISGNQMMRERFRREAEIMIDFRTDFVVDVYDHFKQGSTDYIALEYVDGDSLDEVLLRERYLPADIALFIIRDCFRGLSYVHRKGVVHRDVKPGNVVIGRNGSVKILDFGVAARPEAFEDDLTGEGMTLGTVAYIAPEQIEESRNVDHRADIYSAGAMFYEMVTGRKAFSGGFNPETVNRIQRGKYRRPRRVNPQVSRFASRIIRNCMRRKPSRRYQNAADIVGQIDSYFRKRGEADLREQVALLAGGSSSASVPARRRRGGRLWHLAWIVPVALVLLFAGSFATGYFQRFFLARGHALVVYQLRIRKAENATTSNAVRLALDPLDGGGSTAAWPRVPLIYEVRALETPDYTVFRSRLLTIPAGEYRSTIWIHDTVTAMPLEIAPLEVQWETQYIEAEWDPDVSAGTAIEVDVTDGTTGEPLPRGAVEALVDGDWVPVGRQPRATSPGGDPGEEVMIPAFAQPEQILESGSELAGRPTSRAGSDPPGNTGAAATAAGPVRGVITGIVPGESIVLRVSHSGYRAADVVVPTARETRRVNVRIGLETR